MHSEININFNNILFYKRLPLLPSSLRAVLINLSVTPNISLNATKQTSMSSHGSALASIEAGAGTGT